MKGAIWRQFENYTLFMVEFIGSSVWKHAIILGTLTIDLKII